MVLSWRKKKEKICTIAIVEYHFRICVFPQKLWRTEISLTALKWTYFCPLIQFPFGSKRPSPSLLFLYVWEDNLSFWQTTKDESVSLFSQLKEVHERQNAGPLTGTLPLIYMYAICLGADCVFWHHLYAGHICSATLPLLMPHPTSYTTTHI